MAAGRALRSKLSADRPGDKSLARFGVDERDQRFLQLVEFLVDGSEYVAVRGLIDDLLRALTGARQAMSSAQETALDVGSILPSTRAKYASRISWVRRLPAPLLKLKLWLFAT